MSENIQPRYDSNGQLQDIQKKLKHSESDRKAYAEETIANIKKQRMVIENLKNENMALKETIARINDQQTQLTQNLAQKNASFDSMRAEYEIAIENENQKIREYERNIEAFRERIKGQKKTLGGVNAGAENQNALAKQIKILENRLDKANQKFNEAIATNKSLRQNIDSLRRERVIFDNLYKKLEKELHEKRKNMASIIESANSAYEERDKANDQIQNLKQQAKREESDFQNELKSLAELMEKHRKTLDYIKMTEKQRDETENTAEVEAEKLRIQTQKLLKEKNANTATIEKLQKYEEDLAKIQAATHITDFDKLVETFIKNEEKNFATFKFVNEQSNEIEMLEKQIAELKEEKSGYEGQGTQQDVAKKKVLKDLEENLSRMENKGEFYEFKYHDSVKVLNSICNWLESLYNTLDCDKIAPRDFGHQGVTESNLAAYLGVIEERTNHILATYAARKKEMDLRAMDMLSNGSMTKLRNEMPSFEEVSEDEGEGEKPLTIEEFALRAMQKIENTKNTINKQKKGTGKVKRR